MKSLSIGKPLFLKFIGIFILLVLVLIPYNLSADQAIHFNLTKPGNTQGMTFGKDNNTIYVLKVTDEATIIQLYANKSLKQEYYLWKESYEMAQPQHPNGLTYYNSYLYVVAGESRIFLVKLNADGTMNSRITTKMVDNDYKALNKQSYSIASIGGGEFIVRYPSRKNADGKVVAQRYGVYKFNKTKKIAREAYTFEVNQHANVYNTGQGIGFKKDSTGKYLFFATSNKITLSTGAKTVYKNNILKYKINFNASNKITSLSYSKTIALDRPATSYSLFEVEEIDFSEGGRMYFTGNERNNDVNSDKVRYYY